MIIVRPLYDRASYFDLAGFLGGEGRTEESRSPEGNGEAQAGNSFWLGDAERRRTRVIGKGNRSQEPSEEASLPFE
ncbi:hypothetical protein [Paenibacillus cineris]|uniref:hypothetical protein n=1 Tax=Paenibacillus cineris TaxID=237530 RepID=UPI001B271CBC|nr:hypothetical protein [Paenibacillus cineris]GIO59910.1 hypothetical protein J43TS9_14840 [Paenibacillus cineris]